MRVPLRILATLILTLSASALWAGVEIASPPNNSTINGSKVEIVIKFSSTESMPVGRVEVHLDGAKVTEREYTPPVASGTSAFRWDTTLTPNGKHVLDVVVAHAGGVVGSARCAVTVANQPPDLSAPKVLIVSPKEGEVVSGVTPIMVQASDDATGDPFVTIYVDDSLRSVSNQKPYVYQWDTTKHENGPHMIDASATDDAENQSDAKAVRVIIRNPVKQEPIAAKPAEDLLAPMAVDAPTVAAAPRPGVQTPEAARSPGSEQGEKFEVAQSPVPVPIPEVTAPATPQAAPPSLNVEATIPKLEAETMASGATMEEPEPESVLMAKAEVPALPEVEAAVPEAPSPEVLAEGTIPQTENEAVLMAKALPSEVVPAAKDESILSAPTAEAPKSAVAQPEQNPVLVVDMQSVDSTIGKAENRLANPPEMVAQPTVPKLAAEVAAAETTAEESAPQPILMAKAEVPALPKVEAAVPEAPSPEVLAEGTIPQTENEAVLMAKALPSEVAPAAKSESILSAPDTEVEPTMPVGSVSSPAQGPVLVAKLPGYSPVAPCSKSNAWAIAPGTSTQPKAECNLQTPKAQGGFVHIRPLFEQAGGTVSWDGKTKAIRAKSAKNLVRLKIGSPKAEVNSAEVMLEKAPFVKDGKTMVPADFVTEVLGMEIK
ncbi:MAG: stalk domain-containing protein [Armatimonadota bacterium]